MKSVQTPSTVVVSPERNCPRCGAPLGGFGLARLCGSCMFGSALTAEEPAEEFTGCASGPRRFGDYELLEEIARGGMGVIFKARQLSLNRIVVVKMILRGEFASLEDMARFRAEAETAARLQHPNIVAIHEVGEREGQPYFSMDYVEGQNLAQLAGNLPLPAARAAKYVQTVAAAVHYAHEQGVLHRDLKPSNILIDHADQPRVTDFGLAKRLESSVLPSTDCSLTQSGQVLGSPSFMSPEQAAGKGGVAGPASDVYSLGAILYQLLTGRPPFVAETLTQTLRLVAETEPVALRLLTPSVPRDLETICLKCLQKEPRRRYAAAAELAEELGRFLRDEAIHARPVGSGERLWRWCRRNPTLGAATAAIVLLLVIVAIGSSLAAARLQAANRAGQERLRDSLVSQARAGRWSGRVGQRFDGLEALKQAGEIRPSPELRNEAIACLALVDLRPVKRLKRDEKGEPIALDPSYARYVRGDARGECIVRSMDGDAALARFPGLPSSPYGPYFSPRGRYLAINRMDGTNRPLEICDLERNKIVFTVPDCAVRDLDFSPDERFAYVAQMGPSFLGIRRFAIPSGESRELRQFAECPSAARLNPAGDQLAVSSTESRIVHVLDAGTGEILFSLEHSNVVHGLDWHPEGRLLAAACGDGTVVIWDTFERNLVRVLEGHNRVVTSVRFSHRGDWLASVGWDGFARLWNVWNGRQILSVPGSEWLIAFRADDRALAVPQADKLEICELAGGREWRGFYPTKTTGALGSGSGWSPDGQVFASAQRDGVRLWDTATGRELGLLTLDAGEPWFAAFDPAGLNLVATSDAGLRRWPVKWVREMAGDKLVLGEMENLGRTVHTGGGLFFNQRGNLLAAEVGGVVVLCDWPSQQQLQRFEMDDPVFRCTLSPSGKFCAAWPMSRKTIRIWESATGRPVKDMDSSSSGEAYFTPDDRFMLTASVGGYLAWDTRSWTNLWKLRNDSNQPGNVAFNQNGTMGALTVSGQRIRLFEPATGAELATLEAPEPQTITWLAFNPDGSRLAATTANSLIHVWDLRLIRQELAVMKLDWDSPPMPPPVQDAPHGPITLLTPDLAGRPQARQ